MTTGSRHRKEYKMACDICGKDDFFSSVSGEPVCAICARQFLGATKGTTEVIRQVRDRLGLQDGEMLSQRTSGRDAHF